MIFLNVDNRTFFDTKSDNYILYDTDHVLLVGYFDRIAFFCK